MTYKDKDKAIQGVEYMRPYVYVRQKSPIYFGKKALHTKKQPHIHIRPHISLHTKKALQTAKEPHIQKNSLT